MGYPYNYNDTYIWPSSSTPVVDKSVVTVNPTITDYTNSDWSKFLAEYRKAVFSINKKEENKMDEKKEKLTGYNRVAGIKFPDSYNDQEYYYALYDEFVDVGSKVMVTGRGEGKVVEVVGVYTKQEFEAMGLNFSRMEEVCAVVDDSLYRARVAKRESLANLRKKMDEAIARVDEDEKYARYAEIDGEVGELFQQYCDLLDS